MHDNVGFKKNRHRQGDISYLILSEWLAKDTSELQDHCEWTSCVIQIKGEYQLSDFILMVIENYQWN